jgi:acetyltransferase-like isoleucine patch superfamily enzyme
MIRKSPTKRPLARFDDPLDFVVRAWTKFYSLWLTRTYPFARIGHNISIQYPCVVRKAISRHISLGSDVIIRKDTWLNVVEDGGNELKIVIEDNCTIGARDTISAKNLIHIERDVMVATSVLMQDHHHAYEDIHIPIRDQGVTPGGRIRIESGCWIGQGAAIICNEGELVIGRNSVVGSNALVTKSCPPNSVIIGNPARLARQFNAARGSWVGGEAGRSVVAESARSIAEVNCCRGAGVGSRITD